MSKEFNCQAEYHAVRFYNSNGEVLPHEASSIHHLTPRCIAEILEWKQRRDFQDPNARTLVHKECHSMTDASTKDRLHLISLIKHPQVQGGKFRKVMDLNNYQSFVSEYDRVYAIDGKPFKDQILSVNKDATSRVLLRINSEDLFYIKKCPNGTNEVIKIDKWSKLFVIEKIIEG